MFTCRSYLSTRVHVESQSAKSSYCLAILVILGDVCLVSTLLHSVVHHQLICLANVTLEPFGSVSMLTHALFGLSVVDKVGMDMLHGLQYHTKN